MIGWLIFSIAAIFPIISGISIDAYLSQIYFLLNGIFISVGMLYIGSGYFSFFVEIPKIIFIILTSFLILLPLILFISLGLKLALNFSIITYNIFIMGAFIIPILKWENFKKTVGKSIIFYFMTLSILIIYIPISVISLLQGYSYGLYESNDVFLISINYNFAIISMIVMIIYLIHLEFTISTREKDDLKDKYSHNLGNILQTVYFSVELLKDKKEMNIEKRVNLSGVIEKKMKEAENFLKEIRDL